MNNCSYVYILDNQRTSAARKRERTHAMTSYGNTSPIVQEAEGVLDHAHIPECASCSATGDRCPFDEMPDEEMLYDLADLFKVFADTTRIKILYALMGKELCVAHIADLIGATHSAVSHQLRILKQAHLVKFQRDGKNVNYSLADNHVYTMLAQGMSHICE